MQSLLKLLSCFLLISSSYAKDELIYQYGTYTYKNTDHSLTLTLSKPEDSKLALKGVFDGSFTVGTGQNSPFTVTPNKWFVYFNPPNEIWTFDGVSKLHLYEKTSKPYGLKASSSEVLPNLIEKAPLIVQQAIRPTK
ncbi:hypothetical protein [Rubritalea sp.]|uniref:hypothetical protein n=1 Tax=Rubritalea sp. TaxID=2109375 RepID=UPI003EF85BE0